MHFWAVQLFEMKIEKSDTKMPFLLQNKKGDTKREIYEMHEMMY